MAEALVKITGFENLVSNISLKRKEDADFEATFVKSQDNNVAAGLKEIDLKPIEFLDYQESIVKLKDILTIYFPDSSDSNIITLLLKAQMKVLEYLNDQHINCLVPWDKRTGLPSHPSMVADAQKYANFLRCSEGLKSLLNSFLGWSLFAEEKLLCCCGGSLLKLRNVSFDVMLNHLLRVDQIGGDYFLIVKQLVGVRCGDKGHLKNHYNFGKMSQAMDDLSMIFTAESGFNLKSGQIRYRFCSSQKADQFNFEEFSKRINAINSEI